MQKNGRAGIQFIHAMVVLIFMITAVLPATASGLRETGTEDRKLVIWDFKYLDPTTKRAFDQVDRLFRDQYPGITIEHVGFSEDAYISSLKNALLAGTAPDIFMLHPGAEYLELQSYLSPLDDYIETSSIAFREGILTAATDDKGQVRALPFTYQGIGWYYNRDLFRQAGLDPDTPPRTFDEFRSACRSLEEAGIIPIAAGNNRPLTTDFIRRMLVTAYYSDEEIRKFFRQGQGVASPEFERIMGFIQELRENDWLDPAGIHQPYFNYAKDSFGNGDTAMIPGLLSDIANWKEFSDRLGTDAVGYFPNLADPSMERPGIQLLQSSGIIIGLNRSSTAGALAYSYFDTLFSERSQNILSSQLGMLMPVEDQDLPYGEYPVLYEIQEALGFTGSDLEQYTPTATLRDQLYRYDRLLLNTRELPLSRYIRELYTYTSLY